MLDGLQIIASGILSASWGVLLLLVGAASFCFLFDVLPNLVVVGMAMGLASFLARFPFKLPAAIGMLACSLVMLAWLALLFL